MNSRAFCLALASASLLFAACTRARPGLPPRHILIVTFDSMRADHLSCYAYGRPTSALPSDELERLEGRAFSIDGLAASGVTFANAYAPSPLTLPSLATLFTGLSPVATGVLDEHTRLPRDVPTLAELARAAGFHTAAFVSRPDLDILSAVGRGFETAHWCRSDGETLAFARDWLARDFGDDRQVLLWIHLSGLEPPWQPIPEAEIARPESSPLRFLDPGRQGVAALTDQYDGRISAVAGRLTGFLQDAFDYNRRGAEVTEFWSRTLLVVTATHGFDLGERGTQVGAALHDERLHVPLILRHPDSLQGERVLAPVVELTDVLPTLVELFDLPRPRECTGRSLLGWTDAESARPLEPRSAITQNDERVFSVRDARWRMLWSPYRSRLPAGDPWRELPLVALYDQDASGTDVTADHPDVVARLQQEVIDWIARQHFRPSHALLPEHALESHGN